MWCCFQPARAKKGWTSSVTDHEGTCPQAKRLLPDAYVMGDLGGSDRAEFEKHFLGCPECALAVTLGSYIREFTKQLPRPGTKQGVPCRRRTLRHQLRIETHRLRGQPLRSTPGGAKYDVCEFIRSKTPERYLRGELDDAEQETFEEHYFDCTQCAQLIRAAKPEGFDD